MCTFLLGQFPFEILFSGISLVLNHTAYEVKIPLHLSRKLSFLDCLVHLHQIIFRIAMDGWNLKISGLINGWSYLNVCTGVLIFGSMNMILGHHVKKDEKLKKMQGCRTKIKAMPLSL